MADDEKILRIEAKITEESKKVSDKPVVSSGDGEQVDPAIPEIPDRASVEALDSKRKELSDIASIIDALKHEEDAPLFSLEPEAVSTTKVIEDDPFAKFANTDQIPASAVFGESTPPTEQEQAIAGLTQHYSTLLNAAATPIVPPVSPVSPPPTPPLGGGAGAGVAGAAAVAGAGGAGGAIPPVAGAGPAGAAGGAFLAGLAVDATLLAAGFTSLSIALLLAEKLIDSTFKAMADEWENLSGAIQAAEAQSEVELTLERLKTESRVAQPTADVTQARTEMDKVWIDIKAYLIEVISPLLVTLMEIVETILIILNSILAVIKFVLGPTLGIFRLLNKVGRVLLNAIEWFMGKDREEPDEYLKKTAEFFAKTQSVTAASVNRQGSNAGYPEPQARL